VFEETGRVCYPDAMKIGGPVSDRRDKQMTEQPIEIRIATWDEDRDCIHSVRCDVFCREQAIAEEIVFDGLDGECGHALAFAGSGEPIGTGRVQKDGHLGRIAVLEKWRNRGVGTALTRALIAAAADEGAAEVYLNAQVSAVRFYEKLGFRAEGAPFFEAGIEHYRMVWDASPARSGWRER